jgi:hypothetical protein
MRWGVGLAPPNLRATFSEKVGGHNSNVIRNPLNSGPDQSDTYRMGSLLSQKRKLEERTRDRAPRLKKRVRKQKEYHSSSESEGSDEGFVPVNLNDSDNEEIETPYTEQKKSETTANGWQSAKFTSADGSDEEHSSDDESEDNEVDGGMETGANGKTVSKRNDPEAFSTSISKILSTKLSQAARKDPVLSRSREAAEASSAIANEKLDRKAKAKLRAEHKEQLERGRVRDVLGLSTGEAGETAEEEKRLRKMAQRGVVKLFNAVRAAQIRGEEAAREERKKGTVGIANREEKVNEMTKQGFLDLINSKSKANTLQEA